MNITLFGGAFDPPHNGHLKIARELLRNHFADQVWFVPVKFHAFNKQMASDFHRQTMLENILEPQMKVETFELQQTATNYTYKTLVSLSKRYPEHNFSFVIGSDNLALFHTWDEYEKMIEKFQFYVYPRKGHPLEQLYPGMIILEEAPIIDVSSSDIKEKIKNGEEITSLVPSFIELYIIKNDLYKE